MRFLNKQVPPRHPYLRSQQGITLIELMIALVIGLLATGAMLKVYVDSSQLYRFNESLARIQENGRFGLEFIRRDARMAGFWGCNSAVDPFNRLTSVTTLPNFLLNGYVTGTNGLVSNETDKPDKPDSITFTSAASGSLVTDVEIDSTSSASSFVLADSAWGTSTAGDVLIITDCVTADIFEFKSDTELSKAYAVGSRLYRVQQTTFCIAEDTDAAQHSLHRLVKFLNLSVVQECATHGDDLVEGIENMQILMGEDTGADFDGSVNRYVHPGYVEDSDTGDLDDDRIVSTRISLLAVSPYNNVTTEPASYFFNGAWVDPDDRYLRKEFTTTVALRNKTRIRTEAVVGGDGGDDPPDTVDACFAPLDGTDIMWKDREDALTPDQQGSATACWSDDVEGWVVGCNTASSVCSEPEELPGNWPWDYSHGRGGYLCGGSNVSQSVVQAHASSELCSDGADSRPKCKKVSGVWTPFWGGVNARFGGVGYRCCGGGVGWNPGEFGCASTR